MSENKKVGVVKFWCYSNVQNNDRKTSSEAYRFLKDAIVNAVEVYLRDTQEHSLNVQFACGCPLEIKDQQSVSQQGSIRKSSIVEMSIRDNAGHSLSVSLPDEGDKKSEQEKREEQYVAVESQKTFDQLIVPEETREVLLRKVKVFENYDLIFNTWGLKRSSNPVVALNFFGPPGTGKTLAAHAIASELNKKMIIASYAQIESMYHGEGPKNVEALFHAAQKQDAILFIDEADSLLSKRLTNVRDGSDNAVNSMRSQLLICLEKYRGIVIFATNLVENYDRAFESRVSSIHFPLPDEKCRRQIWAEHLPKELPKANDVDLDKLAKIEDISGRDIRNAVRDVAEQMAADKIPEATFKMFDDAIISIKKSRYEQQAKDDKREKTIPMTEKEKKTVTEVCNDVLKKHEGQQAVVSAESQSDEKED